MQLIVLWDVDHTLIENAGVSKEIHSAAFSALGGSPPTGSVQTGVVGAPAVLPDLPDLPDTGRVITLLEGFAGR